MLSTSQNTVLPLEPNTNKREFQVNNDVVW
jgi:hypothetical protein